MLADVPNPDPEGAAPKAKPAAADTERVPSVKRKDPPPPTGTRFKAAANMVVAMRRFQGAWCVAWRGWWESGEFLRAGVGR